MTSGITLTNSKDYGRAVPSEAPSYPSSVMALSNRFKEQRVVLVSIASAIAAASRSPRPFPRSDNALSFDASLTKSASASALGRRGGAASF